MSIKHIYNPLILPLYMQYKNLLNIIQHGVRQVPKKDDKGTLEQFHRKGYCLLCRRHRPNINNNGCWYIYENYKAVNDTNILPVIKNGPSSYLMDKKSHLSYDTYTLHIISTQLRLKELLIKYEKNGNKNGGKIRPWVCKPYSRSSCKFQTKKISMVSHLFLLDLKLGVLRRDLLLIYIKLNLFKFPIY